VKGTQPAIGLPCDVDFADVIVAQHLVEEGRKDSVRAFEEQLAVWRRRRNDDVAAAFGFGAPVRFHGARRDRQCLRSARKHQDERVCFRRVVRGGQHDFIRDTEPGERSGLLEDLATRRDRAHTDSDERCRGERETHAHQPIITGGSLLLRNVLFSAGAAITCPCAHDRVLSRRRTSQVWPNTFQA
jgi:hypothetical protein